MQSRPRARVVWLLALVGVSLAARLWLLFHRPLWHDETFTAWASRLPPAELVAALRSDSGPPLFYLLEAPLARAAKSPAEDLGLRLLPFAATLALFAVAGTLPRGAPRAWWIALVACFALVNLYAAEARAYAVLSLLAFVVFFLGAVASQTPGRLAALSVAAALALWTHYLALFPVAAALLLALGSRRFRAAAALLVALVSFAPWVPVLLAQPRDAMAWQHEPAAGSALGFLSALGGVGRIPAPFGRTPGQTVLLASAILGAALLLLLAASTRGDATGRAALRFVAVSLGLALAASAWRPVAFAGRCEMAVLPVWAWAIARGAPGRRPLGAFAALAAAAGLAVTAFVAFGPHPRSTAASAAASVAKLARAGDVVVAGPGFYLPALLEAERGRLTARVAALPDTDAPHPGWFVAWPLSPDDVRRTESLAASLPKDARLFLLLPPAYSQPALTDPLSRLGVLRELVRQKDGVLTAWTPAP
ncbi:MAG TPA: hypothetical protein VMN82_16560 [Thermoanaerobaculia bacterium]|nr:hypothetical protein [Thermoanaerobaculia bacterium]